MAHAMPAPAQESSDEILRKNGRSFNFARMFLTKAQGQRSARLYAFCRYVDDLADEASDPRHAKLVLDQVKLQLAGKQSPSGRVADFLDLARETNIDLDVAVALIDGVASDLGIVAFETVSDLLQYAYKVAGTVGLMMCSVLDVTDPRAAPFAIDLGVAMQLTNIARDIQEDAENGRRYVPAKWLEGACANDIAASDTAFMPKLQAAAERLVHLAEIYYESAYDGLGFLPSRSRFAILIAARVYRQIGVKLQRRDFAVWQGRTIVSTAEKLAVASAAGTAYLAQSRFHRRTQSHDADLHISLQGFAGAHAVTR
ncbi:MAG: phytoene/squalene synthase family protein [Pseudomonadota bacterium]